MSPLFTMRHLEKWEVGKAVAFLKANAHGMNMPRTKQELESISEDNRLLVLEEVKGGNRAIVGISGTFKHMDGDYLEFGATRIVENGFGFQKLFFSARIIHEVFMAADFKRIYCTVAKDNLGSISGIKRSGFSLWDPPAEDLVREKAKNAKAQNRSSDVFFYEVSSSDLDVLVRKHALNLLEHEAIRLVRKDGQKTIDLSLNLVALGPIYKDVLLQLASGAIRFSEQRG